MSRRKIGEYVSVSENTNCWRALVIYMGFIIEGEVLQWLPLKECVNGHAHRGEDVKADDFDMTGWKRGVVGAMIHLYSHLPDVGGTRIAPIYEDSFYFLRWLRPHARPDATEREELAKECQRRVHLRDAAEKDVAKA